MKRTLGCSGREYGRLKAVRSVYDFATGMAAKSYEEKNKISGDAWRFVAESLQPKLKELETKCFGK